MNSQAMPQGARQSAPTVARKRRANGEPVTPLVVRIDTACQMLDCGRSTIYKLLKQKRLDLAKVAGCTRITTASVLRVAAGDRPAA